MAEIFDSYQKKFRGDPVVLGRVAVLMGGLSAEREVSLKSGKAILSALLNCGVDAFALDIGEDPVRQLANEKFSRAFIALHGVGGEDGKIQALLDLMNKPYTGSDHSASALAMNKLHAKSIWMAKGLPTPPYLSLSDNISLETVLDTLGHVFVKPVHEGSSIGISPARSVSELEESVEHAKSFDDEVLMEKLIHGSEYSVAVLDGTVLPPIQVRLAGEFYDFDAKYLSDETQYICPAPLAFDEAQHLKKLAFKAFKALGCRGWGRVDFMRNDSGEFFLLEANTVPGMTNHSLVPMAAKECGLNFEELVLEILAMTLRNEYGE